MASGDSVSTWWDERKREVSGVKLALIPATYPDITQIVSIRADRDWILSASSFLSATAVAIKHS